VRCRAASGRFTRCRKGSRVAGLGAVVARPHKGELTWKDQPNESSRAHTLNGKYLVYPNIGYTAWAAAWAPPFSKGQWHYLDDRGEEVPGIQFLHDSFDAAKAAAEYNAVRRGTNL